MKMLILIRHGEGENNATYTLSHDVAGYNLTAKGKAQARTTARELARIKVDALYTSPVFRAKQTAEIIGEQLDLEPEVNDSLIERNLGRLNNVSFPTHDALSDRFKKELATGEASGIEPFENLRKRMSAFIGSLAPGITIAVSHYDTILAALGTMDRNTYGDDNWTTQIPPCSITVIDLEKKEILTVGSGALPTQLQRPQK